MKEKMLADILKTLRDILDAYNIDFWLDGGTLLGAVREGRFIPWERDIDLGTWSENLPKIALLSNVFRKKGFRMVFTDYEIGIHHIETGLYAGIYVYHLERDKAVRIGFMNPKEYYISNNKLRKRRFRYLLRVIIKHLVWLLSEGEIYSNTFQFKLKKAVHIFPNKWRKFILRVIKKFSGIVGIEIIKRITPARYFKELKTIKFYNTTFLIPSEPEEYLSYKYGKDWKIPKKDWIPYKDSIYHSDKGV